MSCQIYFIFLNLLTNSFPKAETAATNITFKLKCEHLIVMRVISVELQEKVVDAVV